MPQSVLAARSKRIRGDAGVGLSVFPDAAGLRREQGQGMSTLWTFITVSAVVAILAVALWVLVVAPIWVPRHSGKP